MQWLSSMKHFGDVDIFKIHRRDEYLALLIDRHPRSSHAVDEFSGVARALDED
jgi:hypothetical protein